MAGKVPLTFKIYKGDQFLREESLSQPVIKVGKLSSSHLRLDDDSVSRMHAVIEVQGPNDISIIDLGSTKGTLVNGQKVNKAKLQEGDEIVLGDIRLELSLAGAEEAAAEEEQPTRVNVPAPSGRPAAPPAPSSTAAAASAPPPAPVAAPPGIPAPPSAPAPAAVAAAAMAPGAAAAAFSGRAQPAIGAESIDDITGARAVEVAGMLGDSVVGVKHVMNPRGGKITSTTYALAAGGAVLLLVAAIAFFKGVGVASYNKDAREHWLKEKKPIHEFRPGVLGGPKRLGALYDWLALGGFLGGIACLTGALVRYRREVVQPYFRIGSGPEVDFALGDAATTSFPLVAPRGDDFVFNFSPNWEGEMIVAGQSVPLAELQSQGRAAASATAGAGALEVPIQTDARFRVNTGHATFLVSSVPQPKKQKAPLFVMEAALLVFFGGSALFHFGTVALLKSIPPDPASLALDSLGADGRLSRVNTKATEDPKQEEEETDDNKDGEREGGTGEKMALDEGKMGKKESTRATGQFAIKNNNADPQLAKQQAIDAARNAGVLGVLSSQQGGAFASLTGTADFSSGLDDRDVYGGLLGNEVGEMAGGWGYGISGVGPGGGGTGWGTIGTGKYGTIGHGSGTGSGYGTGSGRGGMRGRKARPPSVKIGNASATGDLDKNIIRRYIRRKLPRIRNCYEKQLLVNTSLSGTVVTQFQISPQGSVLSVSASGVDPTVASCVGAAIKSIRFPKPKGGGLVNVRYPFTFRPAGG